MPFLASLEDAAGLPLWPLWVGVAVLLAAAVRARRATPALLPAAAGAAWLAIVALMAEAGFSGEARYAVPGAAMLAISGAVGPRRSLARRHAVAAVAVVAAVAAAALPRLDDARRRSAASRPTSRRSPPSSPTVLTAAGGREAVLACGRPYVGRLRGPLMAYRMDVEKRVVEPDDPPRAPGMVFRSRLHPDDPVLPAAVPGGFVEVARTPEWQVLAACT